MNPMEVANQARKEAIDDIVKILESHSFIVTLKVMKKPGDIQIIIPVTKEQLEKGIEVANQLDAEEDGR